MLKAKRAAMEFCLEWQSSFGRHYDSRYVKKIDFWRDLLPTTLQRHLSGLSPGEKYRETFDPGVLVPGYSDKNIIEFPKGLFAGSNGKTIQPVPGRFYPKRYAWRALNSFPNNPTSFIEFPLRRSRRIETINVPQVRIDGPPWVRARCSSDTFLA